MARTVVSYQVMILKPNPQPNHFGLFLPRQGIPLPWAMPGLISFRTYDLHCSDFPAESLLKSSSQRDGLGVCLRAHQLENLVSLLVDRPLIEI